MAKKHQAKHNKKLRRAVCGALSAVFMVSALIVAAIPSSKSEASTGNIPYRDPLVENLGSRWDASSPVKAVKEAFDTANGLTDVNAIIPEYASAPVYVDAQGLYDVVYTTNRGSTSPTGVIVGFDILSTSASSNLRIPEEIEAFKWTKSSTDEWELVAANSNGTHLYYVANKTELTVSDNSVPGGTRIEYKYTMAPCYSSIKEQWHQFDENLYIQRTDSATDLSDIAETDSVDGKRYARSEQLTIPIQYIGSQKYSWNAARNGGSYSDQGVFENASQISTLTIGKNIVAIGDNAFIGCQFGSVSLGNKVKQIGNYAFYNCNQLSTLKLYDANDLEDAENGYAATALQQIGACAFAGCKALKSVEIPNQVQYIEPYCFANDDRLSAVNLYGLAQDGNTSLKQIGNGAFSMCKSLQVVHIADGMNNIGTVEYLFYGCESLQELYLPDNAPSEVVFHANNVTGCSSLRTVKIANDNIKPECGNKEKDHTETDDYYSDSTTGGTSVDCFGADNLGCYSSYPDTYQISSSFVILGNRRSTSCAYTYAKNHNIAFGYTEGGVEYYERVSENYFYTIVKPTDGSTVSTLTKCTLYKNPPYAYQYIIIPEKVGPYTIGSIDSSAFTDLALTQINGNTAQESIEYVYIPSSVTNIGNNTFTGCTGLKTIRFADAMNVQSIGKNAFYTGLNYSAEDEANNRQLRFIGTVSEGGVESVPYQYAMTVGNTFNNPNHSDAKYITYCTDFPSNLQIRLAFELDPTDNTVASAVPTLVGIPRGIEYYKEHPTAEKKYSLDPYYAISKSGDGTGQDELARDALNGYNGSNFNSLSETAQSIITATTVIDVPYGVRAVAETDDYGEPIFAGNQDIKTVVFNSIERVEEKTFDNCQHLVNFRMNSSNNGTGEYIGDFVFENCPSLTNVTLSPTLTEFGKAPFHGAEALTYVDFDNSPYYVCEDNIIYGLDGNGNKDRIVECLRVRGETTGTSFLTEKDFSGLTAIAPYAFYDCSGIITADMSSSNIQTIPESCFDSCVNLYQCTLPAATNEIEANAFKDTKIRKITIPNTFAHISDQAFVKTYDSVSGNSGGTIADVENLIIQGYSPSTAENYANSALHPNFVFEEITTLYTVNFVDGFDNTILHTEQVNSGDTVAQVTWAPPSHENVTFSGWDPADYYEQPITGNLTVTATYVSSVDANYTLTFVDDDGTVLYKESVVRDGYATAPPITPKKNGYEFIGWDPSNYNAIPITKDMTVTAQYYYTGIFDPEPSDDPNNGNGNNTGDGGNTNQSGSESTNKDTTGANSSGSDKNTTNSNSSNNNSSTNGSNGTGTNNSTTTNNNTGTNSSRPGSSVSGNRVNNSNTTSRPNTGTRVDVSKTGINNSNLVSATVTGGNGDNYVVKISDSEAAKSAVQQALLNEYGSLDSIKYFAMDISLYDSTGTTKLENVSGITVNITMPIPEALIVYGGNNKAGAVSSANTLEKLATRFTTIDGVPCMSFTATHFSPYTVYVDTNNLTATGTSDITPKTGDPIEPKWFLSLGLALLSVLTFFMRGSKRKVIKVVS